MRLLAGLKGQRLHEVALTQDTDTTELLGCFEQVGACTKLAALAGSSHLRCRWDADRVCQVELGRQRMQLVESLHALIDTVNRIAVTRTFSGNGNQENNNN